MKENLLKKVFLFWVVPVVIASCTVIQAEAAKPAEAIVLSWVEDPKTTQTITWQTVLQETTPMVEFCEASTPDVMISSVQTAHAKETVFSNEAGLRYVYSVTLQGLKPGTRYVYRIGDGKQWTADGSFRTEPDANTTCKFLLFGDSQSSDYSVWRATLESAYRQNRDADFFINAGDLVDHGQTMKEWQAWFQNGQNVLKKLPFVPVVGNHETYTPKGEFSMPHYFTTQFSLPENGPEQLKEQVYSFDYGNVHFVVLDSQFGEERKFVPDSMERQKAWLERDLAAAKQPWKVVIIHRAPYHNRSGEDKPNRTAAFAPIFESGNVDVVFTAHDHVCARTPLMKNGRPSEAGGVVYMTTGRSGTKTYANMEKKSWNTVFYNPVDQPTYAVVKIEQGVFYAQVLKANGEILDEWVLTKPLSL